MPDIKTAPGVEPSVEGADLQAVLAAAIDREFFHMAGGAPEMEHTTEAGPGELQLAWAVLNTPEMHAVGHFLYRMANGPSQVKMDHGRRQMQIWGLPESVIEWALSCAQPPAG